MIKTLAIPLCLGFLTNFVQNVPFALEGLQQLLKE